MIGTYAECPAGKKPLGGGWFGPGTDEVIIKRMEPDDGGYAVIVQSIVNYDSYIRVIAICAFAN